MEGIIPDFHPILVAHARRQERMVMEDFRDFLRDQFPERFDLSVIDAHFGSLVDQSGDQIRRVFTEHYLGSKSYDKQPVKHLRDGLFWFTTLVSKNTPWGRQFHIKLSNDGFLYPERTDLARHPGYRSRHGQDRWVALAAEEIERVPSVVAFVSSLLGDPAELDIEFFYHDKELRMDLKFFSNGAEEGQQRCVVVTFEPGTPHHDSDEKYRARFDRTALDRLRDRAREAADNRRKAKSEESKM
jgi:hypothetical protein